MGTINMITEALWMDAGSGELNTFEEFIKEILEEIERVEKLPKRRWKCLKCGVIDEYPYQLWCGKCGGKMEEVK